MQPVVPVEGLFKGRHFDGKITILCVSWYTSFKIESERLGDHDGESRHCADAHDDSAVVPVFPAGIREALEPICPSCRRILEDGRDIYRVGGRWVYLYRAVDKAGRTIDFFLSRTRDVNAAKTFLRSAMENSRQPTKIMLDAYAASHRAVREMKETGELSQRVVVRSSQYLNNLTEQDHRRVKQRIRPMLGFKTIRQRGGHH